MNRKGPVISAASWVSCSCWRPCAAGGGVDLSATRWQAVARRHALDPLLLYALALHETGRPNGKGMAAPWPWTLAPRPRPRFYESQDAAREALQNEREDRWSAHWPAPDQCGGPRRPLQRSGDPAGWPDQPGRRGRHPGRWHPFGPGRPGPRDRPLPPPDDDRAARASGRGMLALREPCGGARSAGPPGDRFVAHQRGARPGRGPESRGNYNAWYRAAHQQEVRSRISRSAEVRALQRRLVRRTAARPLAAIRSSAPPSMA
jgi:hypothetical protein